MKIKKIISVLLGMSLISSLVLSGCGNTTSSTSSSATATKEPEKAHVRFTYWNKEETVKTLLDLIKEKLPDVELEYQFIDNKDYDNTVKTQLAAGEGPDIIGGLISDATVKSGYFLDLTNEPFVKGYAEAGLAPYTRNGKVYGVPGTSWFEGYFYNKDLFAQYNVNVPTNFNEFLQVCETFKKAGIKPFGLQGKDYQGLMKSFLGVAVNDYIQTPAGKGFDEKYKEGKITMDGNLNEAMKTWSKLIENGYITQEMLGMDQAQIIDEFAAGKVAIIEDGPWNLATIKEKNPNMKINMFPLLGEKTSTSGWFIGGPGVSFGINANSKNIEAAKKVIALISTPEGQQAYGKDNPGGSSFLKGVELPMPEEYAGCQAAFKEGHVYCPWNQWISGQVLIEELGKNLQDYLGGVKSIEDVLKAVDKKNAEFILKTQ